MKYHEFRNRQQEEFNNFPVAFGFGFGKEGIKKGLIKLGLKESDLDKVVGIGAGGFIRETDVESYIAMGHKHSKEMRNAMADFNFAVDAFKVELANHEFSYSEDPTDAIEALGLNYQDIKADANLSKAFKVASKRSFDCFCR